MSTKSDDADRGAFLERSGCAGDGPARYAQEAPVEGRRAEDGPTAGSREKLRDPNWIAAYALGLASTERGEETCLQELVEAAEGASERLGEARERLQRLDAFDDRLRCRAEQLLASSLQRLEVDG